MLPPELWTIIYEFDPTYKNIYNQCVNELTCHFYHNRMLSIFNSLFEYHRIYCINNTSPKSLPTYIKLLLERQQIPIYYKFEPSNCPWNHYREKTQHYKNPAYNKRIFVKRPYPAGHKYTY